MSDSGAALRELDGNWIGGRLVPSTGNRAIAVVSPVTEEVIGRARSASPADVDKAVTAASAALSGPWARWTPEERAALVATVRERLAARAEEFAELQSWQMGAPIRSTRGSVQKALANLDSSLRASAVLPRRFLVPDAEGTTLVERRPVGVVAAITPWNAPLQFELDKVVAALVTGCTVVLKPAPETPFGAFLLAEVFAQCGLPAGALAVVSGDGEVGEHLVRHPGVARVTFTGSSDTGRRIGALCGARLARASLELGGKSAGIVLADADITATAATLVTANFGNSGQACHALTRVLVPRQRHDELIDAVLGAAEKLVIGDPADETTEIGPLVAERQRDRVESYLRSARSDGARVALGGGRPAGIERGWYVEPTVLLDVTNTMAVAREEVFGPVMSVIAYGEEAEAIAIANDSEYGLGGAVFTTDPQRGIAVASSVHTGMTSINGWGITRSAPFGGVKGSGTGREHGLWGLAESLEYHAIRLPEAQAQELARAGVGTDPVLI